MLTLGQRRTYDFIKKFMKQHDYAPTAAEIAAGTGIKSRGVVHRYLKALVAAQKIELMPKRHRNISLVDPMKMSIGLPLLGAIAAGQPIEAFEDADPIDIAKIFLGEGRYALTVRGDSMIEEGIFDGDIVVCEHADSADNGQIVVALIDNQEATLKRFERTKDQITLHPANEHLQPMVFEPHRVTIQGIFVGLLRTSW
ncbi:MAG: repressor LexA [Coxiella sp. (in: Bacteria)]|nr:MAG: repressor LexA [Coxiella sp. (in: g-proteobacteria)]